jgi:hypothetical protein
MAVKSKTGVARVEHQAGKPKRTRQGRSLRTKLSGTSRNPNRAKRYRGQGR